MTFLLYILIGIASVAITIALAITTLGFIYALLASFKWIVRRINGKFKNNGGNNGRPA